MPWQVVWMLRILLIFRELFFKTKNIELAYDPIILPSYDAMKEDKLEYANSFRVQSENTDPFNGKTLVEPYPNGVYVVQNPPQEPLTRQEMDDIYDLPYERTYHQVTRL